VDKLMGSDNGNKSKQHGRFRDGLSVPDLLFKEIPESSKDHPVISKSYKDGQFLRIKTDLIKSNPDQPRRHIDQDKLNELADTIKEKGLLQPLIVQIGENGDYVLIAGERRLLACKMAGITKVPVIVNTGDRGELALIENIQREDLSPIDEAEALHSLMVNHQYTQEELAAKIGKARSTIAETLSLSKLPMEIKEACRCDDIFSRRQLVEIAKQESAETMINLFEHVKRDGLKSDELRRMTRNHCQGKIPVELVRKMKSFNKFVQKIDPSMYDDDKKEKIVTELNLLIENLKNMLSQLKG
jgi:ParB family transcriptional regulator, chromosome partitioning protein